MEWIDIEDRKPPNDKYVLAAKYDSRPNMNIYFTLIASRIGNEWFNGHDGKKLNPKYGYITHWMPLPHKPRVKKEK